MRKSHSALLVIAAIMCFSSAYSLAAINQVYKINFEWFSQYYGKYSAEKRDTNRDKWYLQDYPEQMQFGFAGNELELANLPLGQDYEKIERQNVDLNKYVLIYATLGRVHSPEYRIKIVDIAQRGNTVEVKVSINSPVKLKLNYYDSMVYSPIDVVRIERDTFPITGKLLFIFKSQDGTQLFEQYYSVE